MTGLPADPKVAARLRRRLHARAALVIVAVVACSGAGAAFAQSSAPLKLTPLAPPPAARSDAPADSRGTVPTQRDVSPATGNVSSSNTSSGGIVVQRLGGIDRAAVGVLAPEQGGLEGDVWGGSSRGLVDDLMQQVPPAIDNVALRDLVRRLLLTIAPPPLADDAVGGDVSLVASRADLLVAMGDVADAERLIAAAGRQNVAGTLAWPAFEARLLANDAAGACRIVRGRGADLAGIRWQKALIFCQLLAERGDEAQFGLNLLRERRVTADPLFFALAEALATRGEPWIEDAIDGAVATPLNLALLRLSWTKVPETFVTLAPPGVAAAIARSADAEEAVRLAAALRAEAAGAMTAADLRALFGALKVTPQELSAALTIADSEKPARAVALLYLSARAQDVPAARAEVLKRLWEVAGAHGVAGTASRVAAPLLADIPLLPEFSWFAGAGARMSLYADDLPRGLGWYGVAAAVAGGDAEAAAIATALWPVIRLALGDTRRLPPEPVVETPAQAITVIGGATIPPQAENAAIAQPLPQGEIALPWERHRLKSWLAAERARDADAAAGQAGTMLVLLDSVGDPVTGDLWRAALPGDETASSVAEPAYRLGLDRAAVAGRKGEAILFAAAALGGRDIASVDIATLHAAVRGLARLGYGPQARALARDVALASGL